MYLFTALLTIWHDICRQLCYKTRNVLSSEYLRLQIYKQKKMAIVYKSIILRGWTVGNTKKNPYHVSCFWFRVFIYASRCRSFMFVVAQKLAGLIRVAVMSQTWSLSARTLRSLVRIPLEAWMLLLRLSVLLACIGKSFADPIPHLTPPHLLIQVVLPDI